MFVGKDFVLKHIRVKHAEKVEEFKQQVQQQPCISHMKCFWWCTGHAVGQVTESVNHPVLCHDQEPCLYS